MHHKKVGKIVGITTCVIFLGFILLYLGTWFYDEYGPVELSTIEFTLEETKFIYSGEKFCPKVITDELVLGEDYEVAYLDNIECGIATAKITPLGRYRGEWNLEYTIIPRTTVVSYKSTTDTITLEWEKREEADKYEISQNINDKWALLDTIEDSSYTIEKLSSAEKYIFKVVAFSNGFSAENNLEILTTTLPDKITSANVKTLSTGANLVWEPISCDFYEVALSDNVDFHDSKTKTTSDTDMPMENYRFGKVRACVNSPDGMVLVGEWSDMRSQEFNQLYSTYSTNYVNNPDRTINLKLACKAINGTIINQGETFSFNRIVGERTEAKGYKEAPIFVNSETTPAVGGGICQVASTMFNAALLGNFEITERTEHSQRVSYTPLGRDATIYWGSYDFRFTNNTDFPIRIIMKCENGVITSSYYISELAPEAPKVSLKVTGGENDFVLTRSVNGNVNYRTKSSYKPIKE